ncbi:MAG: hypothetical protein WD200_00640 [Candidatus Andersenbacteria bacterium]
MWTTKEVERALSARGEFPVTLPDFMHLYSTQREFFFQLACVGVRPSAPKWMREAAIMAAYLRALAFAFDIQGSGTTGIVSTCLDNVPPLSFTGVEVEKVRTFMRSLCGFPTTLDGQEQSHEKMAGQEVTEAHVTFHLGARTRHTWEDKQETYVVRKRNLSAP